MSFSDRLRHDCRDHVPYRLVRDGWPDQVGWITAVETKHVLPVEIKPAEDCLQKVATITIEWRVAGGSLNSAEFLEDYSVPGRLYSTIHGLYAEPLREGPMGDESMDNQDNEMMLELVDDETGWLRLGGKSYAAHGRIELPKRRNWGEAPAYARRVLDGKAAMRAVESPAISPGNPKVKVDLRSDDWGKIDFEIQGHVIEWRWTSETKIECTVPVQGRVEGEPLTACRDLQLDGGSIGSMLDARDESDKDDPFVVIELTRKASDVGWDVGEPPSWMVKANSDTETSTETKENKMAVEIKDTKTALALAAKEGAKLGALAAFTNGCTGALLKFMVAHGLPKRIAKAKWFTPIVAIMALALARVLFVHLGKNNAALVADKAFELEIAKVAEVGFTAVFDEVVPLASEAAKFFESDAV